MGEGSDTLSRAWRPSRGRTGRRPTCFTECATDSLGADDLAAYADTEFWLGDVSALIRLTTAAYDAYLDESRPRGGRDVGGDAGDLPHVAWR